MIYENTGETNNVEDHFTSEPSNYSSDLTWTGQTFFEKKPVSEKLAEQTSLEELLEKEEDMLAPLPLPGVPKSERDRRAIWTKIPQRIRAAIRRL